MRVVLLVLLSILLFGLILFPAACTSEGVPRGSTLPLDVEYMGSFEGRYGHKYDLYFYYDWKRGAEIWIAAESDGVGITVR